MGIIDFFKRLNSNDYKPFSSENAYSLSTIGKVGTYEEVLEDHKKRLLKAIKNTARMNNNYLLWYIDDLSVKYADALVRYLEELDYKVPYKDSNVILVKWIVE